MKQDPWQKKLTVVPIVLCLLPLLAVGRPMWLDEYTTALTLHRASFADAMTALRTDTHHPLYFALLYLWSRLFVSLPSWRLLGVLLHAATIFTLWRGTCAVASARAAAWAVAIFGLCPIVLREATDLRPYGLLSLGVVLALHSHHHHVVRAATLSALGLRVGAYAVLVTTHPVGFLYVAALGGAEAGYYAIQLREGAARPRFARVLWQSAVAYASAAVFFVLMHWAYSRHVGSAGLDWMPPLSLRLVTRTFVSFIGVQAFSAAGTAWCAVLLALALARRTALGRILLGITVGYFALVAGYSAWVLPIFYYRSLLPLQPTLALAAAFALAISNGRRRWLARAAAAVMLLAQLHGWVERAPQAVDQAHATSARLAALAGEHDAVAVYPGWYDTAVRAELPRAFGERIVAIEALPAGPTSSSVAVFRLDSYRPERGGEPLASLARLGSAAPHHIIVYVSDGDDVLLGPSERCLLLRTTIGQIEQLLPRCQVVYAARFTAELACSAGPSS